MQNFPRLLIIKIFILKIALLCIFSLSACAKFEEAENIKPEMEQSSTPLALSEDPEAEVFEDIESESPEEVKSKITETENTEPEDISSAQMQWQVNIYPDMPQPYIEVLKQYEQFMNADNQNLNDESVRAKLGEYVYDELCIYMPSYGTNYNYALADLTGNGFPEMVIASGDRPHIIYNYSETSGIGMEFTTSYFDMTIYQNGIIEYVSAGMYSSTTYVQFQEDVDAWVVIDTIAVDLMEDAYYGGSWGSDGDLDTEITEEEYLRIQEKYITEPMEFEWIPLFLDPFPE
ncbi:MAG: hypothetical protein NC429_14755 [Lachnospiraceae bacterium]|nr:hypothetical protein [Lachnospiraceae bacterium]